MKVLVAQLRMTLCDPHGLQHARLLSPRDSPGKNTRVGCHSLLQGIFLTRGLNPGLLHCRQLPYRLSHLALGLDGTMTAWSSGLQTRAELLPWVSWVSRGYTVHGELLSLQTYMCQFLITNLIHTRPCTHRHIHPL